MKKIIDFLKAFFGNKNYYPDNKIFEGETFVKILEEFSEAADAYIVIYDSSTFTDLAMKYIPDYTTQIQNFLAPGVQLRILDKNLFQKNTYQKIRRILKILLAGEDTQVVFICSSLFYGGGPQPLEIFKEFKRDKRFTYIERSMEPYRDLPILQETNLPKGVLSVGKRNPQDLLNILRELKLIKNL